MKNSTWIFCICIVMSGCTNDNYQFEKELYLCILEKGEAENLDADQIIIDVETFLIKNAGFRVGQLNNTDGVPPIT